MVRMHKSMVWVVVIIIIIIGGYFWYTSSQKSAATATVAGGMGSYEYQCANGSTFTMTPSEDVSSVTLTAGSQGMFTGSVILAKMGDGMHFENTTSAGPLIVFSGAGEEVQLSVGSESTTCNPVPNAEMAPWNWGDAGEGGGVKLDTALIVTESIQGKWQSTDDAKFVREFRDKGVVIDWHDGKEVSSGLFVAFEKMNAPEVPYPLEDGTVYLQLTMKGTQADTLNFKLVKLTPEELQMIYMDRGGILSFKHIE